jgi:DNA-binding CsgD family transcriptional regulator
MGCLCPNCGADLGVQLGVIAAPMTTKAYRRSARGRFGLSRREGEVADYIVDGFTNQQISDAMKISVQVIKNYTHSVFEKIGCANRADMVRIVLLGREPTK